MKDDVYNLHDSSDSDSSDSEYSMRIPCARMFFFKVKLLNDIHLARKRQYRLNT